MRLYESKRIALEYRRLFVSRPYIDKTMENEKRDKTRGPAVQCLDVYVLRFLISWSEGLFSCRLFSPALHFICSAVLYFPINFFPPQYSLFHFPHFPRQIDPEPAEARAAVFVIIYIFPFSLSSIISPHPLTLFCQSRERARLFFVLNELFIVLLPAFQAFPSSSLITIAYLYYIIHTAFYYFIFLRAFSARYFSFRVYSHSSSIRFDKLLFFFVSYMPWACGVDLRRRNLTKRR